MTRADIGRVKDALPKAVEIGESTYGKDTLDFALWMVGVLSAAVQDLCEHVKELENELDERNQP